MKKLLGFLPIIVAIIGLVYGYFDPAVSAYLAAHPSVNQALLLAFGVSEALAASTLIKSNSVMQLVVSFVLYILGKAEHKDVPPPSLS